MAITTEVDPLPFVGGLDLSAALKRCATQNTCAPAFVNHQK
ncbi:MAG: hypothetical protein WBD25_20280 [Terriglobales bacterium]